MKEGGRRFSIPLYWLLRLFVYADIEAYQNEEGVFVANLLCYSSSEEEEMHVI